MNYEIEANNSKAFVYNSTQLTVNYSAPIKTSCSGNLCDRQRITDWLGSKGCGCYGMSTNSTSLAIQHAITIRTALDGKLTMTDFSSLRFSKLYTTGEIPESCKLYMLQVTEASMNMFNALENCAQLINSQGGFTVVGWYKKGLINDKSLIVVQNINNGGNAAGGNSNTNQYNNNNETVQVESGDVSYHIISISPTNRDFFYETTQLSAQLKDLKFHVSHIDNSSL